MKRSRTVMNKIRIDNNQIDISIYSSDSENDEMKKKLLKVLN